MYNVLCVVDNIVCAALYGIQLLKRPSVVPEFWSSLMCDLGLMYNTIAKHMLDRPPLSKLSPPEVTCYSIHKSMCYGLLCIYMYLSDIGSMPLLPSSRPPLPPLLPSLPSSRPPLLPLLPSFPSSPPPPFLCAGGKKGH